MTPSDSAVTGSGSLLSHPFLRQLQRRYPTLSPGFRRLADVVLRDPLDAAFLSAAELARAAGVSESTVTRFAQALALDGFPGLNGVLQQLVRAHLRTGDRLLRARAHPPDGYGRAMAEDLALAQALAGHADEHALGRVVDRIVASRTVFLAGARSAAALAVYLELYLRMWGKQAEAMTGDPAELDVLGRAGAADLAIVIGFSRYAAFTVRFAEFAHRRQIPVVAITDHPGSPLARHAQEVLIAPSQVSDAIESLVAAMMLVQALVRGTAQRLPPANVDEVKALEPLWDAFGVYAPGTGRLE